MAKPKLLRQTQNREFFGHHMLLHASELQLQAARQSETGRFNHCLAAMTLTALAVEALVNAVGSRAIEDWPAFERLKPFEKINQLQAQLGFPYDPSKSPWVTIRYLAKLRNDIVHAKPQPIEEAKQLPEGVAHKSLFQPPLSKLEREITIGNAGRALEAVQLLKGILTDALAPELRVGIYVDAWSGSTTAAN